MATAVAIASVTLTRAADLNVPLDHPTIQAAIDAASAGDTIIVAPGTYAEQVLLNKDVTLEGANAGISAGAVPALRVAETVIDGGFIVSAAGASIDGVTIQKGRLSGSVRVGVAVSASNVTVTNTIIEDVGVLPAVVAQSDGLSTQPGVDGLTVTNSTIRNNWRGIYLNPGSGHTLTGNLITANNGVGVGIGSDGQSGLTLTGNTISNHTLEGWGASAVGSGVSASGNTFLNNGVSVAHYGGSAIDASNNYWGSPTGPGGAVSGNVVTLPYYTDAGQTTLGAPVTNTTQATYHSSIQGAINAATAGDEIVVSAGTYIEGTININKAVRLEGPNAGVEGSDPGRGAEARLQNSPLSVTAAAEIDGFEIFQTDNSQDAVLLQAAATLSNSVIRREGVSTGSSVRGVTTSVGLTGFSISGNLFSGDSSGGMFGGHKTWNSGMYINGGSGSITGNVFESCRTAINFDDFNAGLSLTGNTFRACGTYLAFGGLTPTSGQFAIAGNEFHLDWGTPPASTLPSALFNNSNVAAGFRLDVTGNTFGGVATTALTAGQKFAIEARNFHRGRSSRNGVVDFVANQQVVTPGTTIQSAVNAAAAGDSVLVGNGTFTGNVSIGKALTLTGNGAATTTIAGVSDSSLGALQLAPNAGQVTIENLTVVGIDGPPGLEKSAIYLQGNQSAVTIRNNTITANGDAALMVEFGATVSDLVIEGNLLNGSTFNPPGTGGTAGDQFSTPNWPRSLVYIGGPGKSDISFTGNTIDGVSGDSNNSNVMINIDAAGAEISGNQFDGDNGSRPGVALLRARGSNTTIDENTFTGQSAVAVLVGSGSSNTAATSVVSENSFVAPYTAALVNASASSLDGTRNFWGGATGPEGDGSPYLGTVSFSPWYADNARTILVTADNFIDQEVPEGDAVEEEDLYIGGGTYTVRGRLVVNGELTLVDGATLNVVNGDLVINGSVLSGTFTFFNSLGSVNFNDDVSISGSAEGLILVSDVHVADGATVTVDGSLVIDGSVVDCQDPSGRYNVQINDGASFTMARTVFINGDMVVESGDASVYDNRFENSTIEVDAGAAAARVFHNITDDPGWLTGPAVTTVDGWGNVTAAIDTENNLALGLDISGLPADRTQDLEGNVFIQPLDSLVASIDVSDLQGKIVAAEVMLGYNTSLIDGASLDLVSDWNVLINDVQDDSNVIGLLDAALGLSFDFADPAGSDADQSIGGVELDAGVDEGRTLFFHRVKLASDSFGGETRLTSGGPSPSYLTPFSSNSALITIDGTDPLIADPASYAAIEQGGDDVNTVTTPAAVVTQGAVVISASAFDALAGIDDAKAVVTLVGPTTYTAVQTGVTAGPSISGDDYTTYEFAHAVDSTTLNGIYDVVFTVTDRSGNQTVESLGSILINKNQVLVNIELQGLVAGPVTRDVVLVFTNSGGGVIETRTEPVVFTNGTGSVVLTDVDGSSFRLSAKTAWNLRNRLPVGLDPDGQATVSLTGSELLRGGDINGDNTVNTLDYSILRYHWFTVDPTADIDGGGSVQTTDFNILQTNFYQVGDPQ